MQYVTFNARCPFEIGDKVVEIEAATIEESQVNGAVFKKGQEKTITDIACVHYLKSGKIDFLYELNGNGRYVRIQEHQQYEVLK